MQLRSAALMLSLLPLGCVNALDTDLETGLAAGHEEGSVIVGSVNWTDVTQLPSNSPERINSHAVGYLSIPARGTRCTAFLIAPDVVMTNEHCIPGDWAAEGATVSFRRERGVTGAQQSTWDCSVFIGNDPGLDFALLHCPERPGDVHGVLTLESRSVQRDDALYVIHQNCDYYAQPGCNPIKQYSPGRVTRVSQEIGHDADTLGGSSGSPVFSRDSHAVFALHHVGIGGNSYGRGSENRAVKMSDILPVLRARYPWLELGGSTTTTPSQPSQPSQPAQPADALEPNDTTNVAPLLPVPFTSQGLAISHANDRDLYLFDTNGGTRTIRIEFNHAQGDLDLYLWSASGQLLGQSTGTGNVEGLTGTLPAGRYIIDVRGYAGATGAYTLKLQ